MNLQDIAERHWKLWEDQNKQIRRTTAASLIFAVIALFNIIIPYQSLFSEKAEISRKINQIETELQMGEEALQYSEEFDGLLVRVAEEIRLRPWDEKRVELIEKYQQLSAQRHGTPGLYQRMADSTVRAISDQVRETVLQPLKKFLEEQPAIHKQTPEMQEQVLALEEALAKWEKENMGRLWYRTLNAKERTINDLSTRLDEHLISLSVTLQDERDALKQRRVELQQKMAELRSIDLKSREKEVQKLQDRMEQVLPSWLRGLISIEQLALYFPHIIAGLLLFVLWLGRSLSIHYDEATSGLKDKSAASDPALSTPWTLTNRGRWGILQSIGAYLLYSLVMIAIFEKALSVLNASTIAKSLRHATLVFSPYFFWTLRAAMIGSLLFILVDRLGAHRRA